MRPASASRLAAVEASAALVTRTVLTASSVVCIACASFRVFSFEEAVVDADDFQVREEYQVCFECFEDVVGRLEAPAEALGPRRRAERRVLRVARVRVRRPRQSSEEDPPHEEAG